MTAIEAASHAAVQAATGAAISAIRRASSLNELDPAFGHNGMEVDSWDAGRVTPNIPASGSNNIPASGSNNNPGQWLQ